MDEGQKIRADKWLWQARFFKTRGLAAAFCREGKLRINGGAAAKAGIFLKIGDTLTFVTGGRLRVAKVAALGTRRGPAEEARLLYEDLSPPPPKKDDLPPPVAARPKGSGRPTKAQRRATDRLKEI